MSALSLPIFSSGLVLWRPEFLLHVWRGIDLQMETGGEAEGLGDTFVRHDDTGVHTCKEKDVLGNDSVRLRAVCLLLSLIQDVASSVPVSEVKGFSSLPLFSFTSSHHHQRRER